MSRNTASSVRPGSAGTPHPQGVRRPTAGRLRGFTLIEVLIALAVLAIALSAVIKGVSANVNNAAHLRDRMLAHWVVMNKLAELQVDAVFPVPGVSNGTALMAEQEWAWQVTVSNTPDPSVRRLDVEVRSRKEDKQPLDSMVGYVGQPQ